MSRCGKKKGFVIKLGMGGILGFWMILGSLKNQISLLKLKVMLFQLPTEHLVANLIDQDSRQWDRGKLAELFILESVNRILGIHLSH